MNATQELPQQEGWYWLKLPLEEWKPVEVRELSVPGLHGLCTDAFGEVYPLDLDAVFDGALWSDEPIKEPV